MSNELTELKKKIAILERQMMEFRMVKIRQTLNKRHNKERRIAVLESRLVEETKKTNKNNLLINELLDEMEAIL